MIDKLNRQAGFTALENLCIVLTVLALSLVGYLLLHTGAPVSKDQSTATVNSTTSSNPYAILSPATVPSKVAECSQAPTFQSNGNSGPVQCANGDLNVEEWNTLAALLPTVMTLGYNPGVSQVESALCADANASDSDANTDNSFAVETTVYQITALYYGWTFSPSPAAVLTNSSC